MTRRPLPRGEAHSLGDVLRASRLGFGWADRLGAWLRLRTPDETGFVVDLVPPGQFPPRQRADVYRAWWEEPVDACELFEVVLAAIAGPVVRRARVRRPLSLTFADDGTPVAVTASP